VPCRPDPADRRHWAGRARPQPRAHRDRSFGLVLGVLGYLLLHAGTRRLGLSPGQWWSGEFDRTIKWVLLEGFVGLFGFGCAVAGVTFLVTGAGGRIDAAILLALAVMFAAAVVALELSRRQIPHMQRYQLLALGGALGLASLGLLAVGIPAEDAGRLVTFGVLGAVGALAALAASATRS